MTHRPLDIKFEVQHLKGTVHSILSGYGSRAVCGAGWQIRYAAAIAHVVGKAMILSRCGPLFEPEGVVLCQN